MYLSRNGYKKQSTQNRPFSHQSALGSNSNINTAVLDGEIGARINSFDTIKSDDPTTYDAKLLSDEQLLYMRGICILLLISAIYANF